MAQPQPGPLLPVIDAILAAPVKQRHPAKQILERLRNKHGSVGG